MSRPQAIIAIVALTLVFLIQVIGYLIPPYNDVIPEPIGKLVAAILVGVTIGLILNGFKRGGG